MAEMMRLQIVTPDEAFFDGEVSMVELNTADGEAGIYPKHIPMVVAVAPGVLKIHGADGVKKASAGAEKAVPAIPLTNGMTAKTPIRDLRESLRRSSRLWGSMG